MKHLFVSYELALELKNAGFDEPCFAYYDYHIYPKHFKHATNPRVLIISKVVQNHNGETEGDDLICSAPLYQQAIDWFREKHKIYISVDWSGRPQIINLGFTKDYAGKLLDEICIDGKYGGFEYNEALNYAIEASLKLIK